VRNSNKLADRIYCHLVVFSDYVADLQAQALRLAILPNCHYQNSPLWLDWLTIRICV